MDRVDIGNVNAVVIGASSESIYAIQQARKMGITVIALDGDPQAPGLQHANDSFVVDIRNPDRIFRILDRFSPNLSIPIPIGRYLTSLGAVNDHYHLPGVTQKAAMYCTDKHLFHAMLARENLRNVEHVLISAVPKDIHTIPVPENIHTLSYPVIVKPRYGSGNRAVKMYMNESDLRNAFFSSNPPKEDFVIESFVDGKEYGVDAAIIHGMVNVILLREKVLTPSPYCQCTGYFSVIPDHQNTELFRLVEECIQKAGAVLGLDNCLLHADIIREKDGSLFVIEMSARPSGHNLHNLFVPMATGVDMISEFLKYSLPQLSASYSFAPVNTRRLLIRYFDLPAGQLQRVPLKEDLHKHYPLLTFECHMKEGMRLKQVTDGHSLMSRGFYIVEGSDQDDLISISNDIQKEFVVG